MILQLENKLIDVKIRIRDKDAQILSDGTHQQPVLDQRLQEMGDRGFHFCLLHTVIAIWRGIFWLKWQGNKLG